MKVLRILFFIFTVYCVAGIFPTAFGKEGGRRESGTHQEYASFFREVFDTMREHYYRPLPEEAFDRFMKTFDEKIYAKLRLAGKTDDYIRWRSAAKMIEELRDPEDIFSAFYPPEPAKEYEQTALGKKIDLGIDGEMEDQGLKTTQVEPRADAYEKGLRIGDIVTRINGQNIAALSKSDVMDLLTPLAGSVVRLAFLDHKKKKHSIEVVSREYFKQMLFEIPTKVPGIYGLELRHFNRKTGEDMFRFLEYFRQQGPIKGLIIDLRGNPGGPPLAAREIASFFLPPNEEFAYFQRRGEDRSVLDVPALPKELHYNGPMVILIDKKSGSASELFSGVMQKRGRAVLMGENSAGQVMLKSMFHFDDGSMVLLVTARGHHPDGSVFSFQGLMPDRYNKDIEPQNIIDFATLYLVYANQHLDKI